MTTMIVWGGGTGDWFVVNNWGYADFSPPNVPDAQNDVRLRFNVFGTPLVSYDGTSTINTLTGVDGQLDIIGGGLTILNGGTSTGTRINLGAGATLTLDAGTFTAAAAFFSSWPGTVDGGGTLVMGGNDIGSTSHSLLAGLTLSVANWTILGNAGSVTATLNTDLGYGGAFTLRSIDPAPAALWLNGFTLTLSGSAILDGRVDGPGTLQVTGTATLGSAAPGNSAIGNGATLRIGAGGSAVQHEDLTLGSDFGGGTLRIDAGGSYTIDASVGILRGSNNGRSIENAGTLAVTGAGTQVAIMAPLTGAGTIDVGGGATLRLFDTATLSGTVSGAGTLLFGYGARAQIDSTTVTVGAIQLSSAVAPPGLFPATLVGAVVTLGTDLTYAGRLSFGGAGTLLNDVVDLNGHTLTLSSADTVLRGKDVIDGPGTLRLTGSATVGDDFAFGGNFVSPTNQALTLRNSGAVTQVGSISLYGTLQNDAGAQWTIVQAGNITSKFASTVVNDGTLTVSAAGISSIVGALINTGALIIDGGALLDLRGSHTLGGTVSGGGTLLLDSGVTTLTGTISTVALAVAKGARAVLGQDVTYAGGFNLGAFGEVALNGHTLRLTGSVVIGGADVATVIGSAGVDTLLIEASALDLGWLALADWTAGVDSLRVKGTSGADSIRGSAFGDSVAGGKGADSLVGGDGNDSLDGGKGADSLVGGAGDDLYVVDSGGDVTVELALGGHDTVRASVNLTLAAGVEDLVLTGKAKTGTGNTADNRITGTGGDNSLSGLSGADTLEGGDGADTLDGGTGADSMAGGAGDDSYVVDDAGDAILEAAGPGTDTVRTSLATYALGTGLENLTLLSGATEGIGNAGNNALTGNGGNNSLSGLGGRDELLGSGGDDVLLGGQGADTLEGGSGLDSMDGGDAGDLFRWLAPNHGRDTIAGFAAGQDDLAFSAAGFGGGLVAGVALTAAQLELNTTGLASTTLVRFVLNTNTGVLTYDANGSGTGSASTIATFVGGVPFLTTADFVVIA